MISCNPQVAYYQVIFSPSGFGGCFRKLEKAPFHFLLLQAGMEAKSSDIIQDQGRDYLTAAAI